MICVTICDFGLDACRHALRRCEKYVHTYPDIIAEVRLDLCGLSEEETQTLFDSSQIPLISTCRRRSRHLLLPSVLSGASYVDIDGLQSDARINETLHELRGHRVKTILSYTDYQKTPTLSELCSYVRSAASHRADIVRITADAGSIDDCERILSLYRLQKEGALPSGVSIAACSMGCQGTYTSIEALRSGAPMVCCTLNDRNKLYPGMLTFEELTKSADRTTVGGEFTVPGSKDMTQKAILAAVLACGASTLSNYSPCRDTEAALSLARKKGGDVTEKGTELTIEGRGAKWTNKSSEGGYLSAFKSLLSGSSHSSGFEETDFVGESGLLARLCIPIAAQSGHQVSVTGEGELLERRMTGAKSALEQFGASCILTSKGTLPAIINGPLTGTSASISSVEGTQLASGLVMALPLSKKDSTLEVKDAISWSNLRSTIDIVRSFGIELNYSINGSSMILDIPGRQKYMPANITLEGDWSIASNFMVAAAISGQLRLYGLDVASEQVDMRILEVLAGAGARVAVSESFIDIGSSHLVPFDFNVAHNPDLFPILAVLAAYCEGTSVISGLGSVNCRQGRRVETTCAALKKMGVFLSLTGEDLTVKGICMSRRLMDDKLLSGGDFISNGDHRVAMALMVAGIFSQGKVSTDDTDCVAKSYPKFRDSLNSILVRK